MNKTKVSQNESNKTQIDPSIQEYLNGCVKSLEAILQKNGPVTAGLCGVKERYLAGG